MLATNLNTSLDFFFFLERWLVFSRKADLFRNAIFSFQNLESYSRLKIWDRNLHSWAQSEEESLFKEESISLRSEPVSTLKLIQSNSLQPTVETQGPLAREWRGLGSGPHPVTGSLSDLAKVCPSLASVSLLELAQNLLGPGQIKRSKAPLARNGECLKWRIFKGRAGLFLTWGEMAVFRLAVHLWNW